MRHSKLLRLKGYDYSSAGLYFITICCQDMVWRFGRVENGEMILNEFGQIAHDEWIRLAERYGNFELDVFQIMPNHMHGIIKLNDGQLRSGKSGVSGVSGESGVNPDRTGNEGKMPSIADIVGAYKSIVSNNCLEINKIRNQMMGKLWHRNYYEHIIRNERAYDNISNYILNNPKKWEEDKFYKG